MQEGWKRLCTVLLTVAFVLGMLGTGAPKALAVSIADPAVTVGEGFLVALDSEGNLWSWGNNASGQLGLGSVGGTHNTPEAISATVSFVQVSAGKAHVLALASDGSVWSWGANESGQLGLNDTTDRTQPTKVADLSAVPVTKVVAGGSASFALTSEGKVYAWGSNQSCMLANSELDASDILETPTEIASLSSVRAADLFAGEATVGIIASDGSVWLWGENSKQQAGVSGSSEDIATPTQKSFSSTYIASSIAFGSLHTAFLLSDSSIVSFGLNKYGQFGTGQKASSDNNTSYKSNLATLPTGLAVASIAAGSNHAALLTKGGEVYTWGRNDYGQLGQEPDDTLSPTKLTVSTEDTVSYLAAGYNNTAVIDSEGHVLVWGSNESGQIGDNTKTDRTTPTVVLGAGGEGRLYLGFASEDFSVNAHITATAVIPAPSFQITIPSGIDFGTLEQKSSTAEDKIAKVDFSVTASELSNLFGKQIVVKVAPSSGDDFVLTGSESELTYCVYATASGGTALTKEEIFAVFSENGSVNGRVEIDQSEITAADTYEGTLTFYVSTEDP